MAAKDSTDPELIKAFLAKGGKVKKGKTHLFNRNISLGSGNHHRLIKPTEVEPVKVTWEKRKRGIST